MGSTNFPQGVSATTTLRTNDGEVYGTTLVTTGAASIGGALTVTGDINGDEVILGPLTFGSASTSETIYVPVPFSGNVIGCWVVQDTSARAATYSVKVGSAGAVVATSAVAVASAGVMTAVGLTAGVSTVAAVSGTALSCNRAAQGTTGVTSLSLLLKRT